MGGHEYRVLVVASTHKALEGLERRLRRLMDLTVEVQGLPQLTSGGGGVDTTWHTELFLNPQREVKGSRTGSRALGRVVVVFSTAFDKSRPFTKVGA